MPGFDLERRIVERAEACGITLSETGRDVLALHARAVLRESAALHLTSITDPGEFFERHIGEAFEGAAMLPADASGTYVDLGSGNGYPGLPLAAARPGLRLVLADASVRKAGFLRAVVRDAGVTRTMVFEAQVQRAADLEELGPVRVLTSRAMGGWAKILPRLTGCLEPDGDVLVWAGEEAEKIVRRVVWRRLRLEDRRALPGRERSWIWRFRKEG